MQRPPRVKHIRLFGCRVDTDSVALRWLLQYAGRSHAVEHIEVNTIASEHLTDAFQRRSSFQSVPLLEIVFDGAQAPDMACTKKAADLKPWKPGATCKATDPNDRVLQLSEIGTISVFLCEHLGINVLCEPSIFQRCRTHELTVHSEIMSRRSAAVFVFLFTKAHGATEDDIITAINAHERELMWSLRQMEAQLIVHEEASAVAAGLDYALLLEQGAAEVMEQEQQEKEAREEAGDSEGRTRAFSSPTLVALDAYISGRSLSAVDFLTTADLQLLPYFQSWLPEPLRQRNFPVINRYLARMRKVAGYDDALKPFLTFLKLFRRRPRILADNPMLTVVTVRLKQVLESKNKPTDRVAQYVPDVSLLPAQQRQVATAESNAGGKARQGAATSRSRQPKRQTELTPWAPRLMDPFHHARPFHHFLSERDEALLRSAKRPTKTARSSERRKDHASPDDTLRTAAPLRAKTAEPATAPRPAAKPMWKHDPYLPHDTRVQLQAAQAHCCGPEPLQIRPWQQPLAHAEHRASPNPPALSPAQALRPQCVSKPEPLSTMSYICSSVGGPKGRAVGHFLGVS